MSESEKESVKYQMLVYLLLWQIQIRKTLQHTSN